MNAEGGFPIDIVLFGMVAVFLVLRLRSILGRRDGFEPARQAPPQPAAAAAPPPRANAPTIDGTALALPAEGSPAARALADLRTAEPGFDPAAFLNGSLGAFRMIVAAFAQGDRATLHTLLGPDAYASFDAAIGERERNFQTQHSDIQAIPRAEIVAAGRDGTLGRVTVRFTSRQISYTANRDGSLAAGVDSIMELNDLWTFERVLGAPDPTWRLVSARSD